MEVRDEIAKALKDKDSRVIDVCKDVIREAILKGVEGKDDYLDTIEWLTGDIHLKDKFYDYVLQKEGVEVEPNRKLVVINDKWTVQDVVEWVNKNYKDFNKSKLEKFINQEFIDNKFYEFNASMIIKCGNFVGRLDEIKEAIEESKLINELAERLKDNDEQLKEVVKDVMVEVEINGGVDGKVAYVDYVERLTGEKVWRCIEEEIERGLPDWFDKEGEDILEIFYDDYSGWDLDYVVEFVLDNFGKELEQARPKIEKDVEDSYLKNPSKETCELIVEGAKRIGRLGEIQDALSSKNTFKIGGAL